MWAEPSSVEVASCDTQIVEQAMTELLAHLGGMSRFIQRPAIEY